MPAGRYSQRLTTFDLLGNFVPGIVVLVTILMGLPEPPLPSSPADYVLFGISAFSLGNVVQEYASLATGDRRSFDETMDAARQLERPPGTAEERQDDDSGEPQRSGDESRFGGIQGLIVGGLAVLCRALLDPVRWPRADSRGEALETVGLANQVWRHILDAYDIERGTDNHSQLYHLMSSELDDVNGPSRALRFQAIRNFHRGMWIATWAFLVLLVGTLVVDFAVAKGTTVLGVTYNRPAVYGYWQPVWQIAVVVAGGAVVFWYLAETYEEEFIEYLFTDYAVVNKDSPSTVELVNRVETEDN